MAITIQELGQRLKKARELNQITQEEAARVIKISRSTLALIEEGKRNINTVRLEKLAELYGKHIYDFLSQSSEISDLSLHFRIEKELKEKIDKKVLNSFFNLLKEYSRLEKMLYGNKKLVYPVKYDFPSPSNMIDAILSGEKLAEDERNRLQIGIHPLGDITKILEEQKVKVLNMPMDDSISGISINDEEIGLVIFVNSKHHYLRRIFTIAHEYCHILLDREQKLIISNINSDNLLEIRANSFAAAFLLPKGGIENFFKNLGKTMRTRNTFFIEGNQKTHTAEDRQSASVASIKLHDLVHLQYHYKVSWETLIHRLKNINIINKKEHEELIQKKELANTLGNMVYRNTERIEDEEQDFKMRFLSMSIDAFNQSLISKTKLEELVKMIQLNYNQLEKILLGSVKEQKN